MDYYAKYRRNMAGMRLALEKLALVESYTDRVVATNNHELMRLHEAFDLLELCRAHLEACLQRKESGRGMYHPQGRRVPVRLDGVIPHLSQGETTCLRFLIPRNASSVAAA